MEIVEKVRQQLKQLDGIRSDQQKKLGERDGILKQLNDLGYKTIDEARVALKELEAQHDQVSVDLMELSKEMDIIIAQAKTPS